ncbi:MAG: acetylornithine transaminase [Pseudomonadota bacterium]
MNSWIERCDKVIAHTYSRTPLVLVRGDGCKLWDVEGNEYLDFVAGIAVCNLGHSHPAVVAAVSEQSKRLVHVSNLYYTTPQTELAEWLVSHSFADKVFFANSGAEANEAAIKLSRRYFYQKLGVSERYKIITMQGSFHGRTMATLTATGQSKVQGGFDPLLAGFAYVPFNDIEAVANAIDDTTCAVMLEPILGEGGVRVPSDDYLLQLRRLCDSKNVLLILDEVQTGMGRTGKLFAYEHYGIEPDIMTIAKAMANGLPMGAMLARGEIAEAFTPGSHASTFGGTPLVAAAALAASRAIESEALLPHCGMMGDYLMGRLIQLQKKHPSVIVDIRGKGLLLAAELSFDGAPIVAECLRQGFIINCVHGKILRFIPPLIVTADMIDSMVKVLDAILTKMEAA